jgi:hypothetical protein
MGIWPFGREKADVDTASRVVVLRARDAVPMRAKVTVKFAEPQTQAAADQAAETCSDLLRNVVREAPAATSVLGYEAAIAAAVIARLPHETAALRSMEVAGLHIVGDPGHAARPTSSPDAPEWLHAVPQPSSSSPTSSDVRPIDRSLDRPTPIHPIPTKDFGLQARTGGSNPTPAQPYAAVKRVTLLPDRPTPVQPLPGPTSSAPHSSPPHASAPSSPGHPAPPSSAQPATTQAAPQAPAARASQAGAPPASTHPAPYAAHASTPPAAVHPAPYAPAPSAHPAPYAPAPSAYPPPHASQAPAQSVHAPHSTHPAPPQVELERTVRSPMERLPGAPASSSGHPHESSPASAPPRDPFGSTAVSPTHPAHLASAARARALSQEPPPTLRHPSSAPPPKRPSSAPPPKRPSSAPPPKRPSAPPATPSRPPSALNVVRLPPSSRLPGGYRAEDPPERRSASYRPPPPSIDPVSSPAMSISGGRYTSRPPPGAVAARRRVVAARLALPNGAGPYEVARGLTPLFRDTAGRILVAFLRAYDLTVVRRVPFDAVEGDILSSLTAPSDGAPGTYAASHAPEIARWRDAFGAEKMERLQREANLAAAAVGYEMLAAEGVPQSMTNALIEGLAGSAYGDPDLVVDLGRYLFPANGTTSAETMASMLAIAPEDPPPGLETALEPLFAALREDVAAAALIAKEVMMSAP